MPRSNEDFGQASITEPIAMPKEGIWFAGAHNLCVTQAGLAATVDNESTSFGYQNEMDSLTYLSALEPNSKVQVYNM